MEKKLPGVFQNKISKKINNNKNVYYGKNEETRELKTIKKEKKPGMTKNVNQKIKDIFNSTRYVYKADVIIKTKDDTITKKIIGKNTTSLITMDNELIPIADIVDINFDD